MLKFESATGQKIIQVSGISVPATNITFNNVHLQFLPNGWIGLSGTNTKFLYCTLTGADCQQGICGEVRTLTIANCQISNFDMQFINGLVIKGANYFTDNTVSDCGFYFKTTSSNVPQFFGSRNYINGEMVFSNSSNRIYVDLSENTFYEVAFSLPYAYAPINITWPLGGQLSLYKNYFEYCVYDPAINVHSSVTVIDDGDNTFSSYCVDNF